jgi:GNAT superfamily N-acetyltransferase
MSIKVRFAEADELHLTREIAYNTWPVAYSEIINSQQMNYMLELFYADASLLHQFHSLQHRFLIALDREENCVGFASYSTFTENNQTIWKLHKLYVQPFSQKTGTGRALLNFIFEEMRNASALCLKLNVNRNNKAVEFYHKMGFNIERSEDIDIGNGYFMNDFVMSILV